MTIKAILQGREGAVHSIKTTATLRDAVAMLAEKRIGAMPVAEGDQVLGIISERDVLYGLAREGAAVLDRSIAEVMISPAITVDSDTEVMDALALMTLRRIRHLPVVDGGSLTGFVSIGDLVKYRIDRIEAEATALRDYIQMA